MTNEPLIALDRDGAHVASPIVAEKLEKKKISASLITGIESCSVRWLADSFVVRDLITEEPDSAARRGSLFHKIMEDFFKLSQEERTTKKLKAVVNEVLNDGEFADLATNPDVIAWLKNAINSYYSMGGRPEKVEVAQVEMDGKTREGLEIFVQGNIGNAERSVLGFVDRLIVDQKKDDGSLVIEDWKGLALDTLLPTPTGWTTMEDVQVGDTLLGTEGQTTKVLNKSDIHHRECYQVDFKDGSSIVCDNVHLWDIVTPGTRDSTDTVNADELYEIFNKYDKESIAIMNPLPIEGQADVELSDRAYDIGVKLCEHEIDSTLEVTEFSSGDMPSECLRMSIEDRVELVQGLFDTRGGNDDACRATFTTSVKKLAMSVMELIVTLGVTPEIEKTDNSEYVISFFPVWFNPYMFSFDAITASNVLHGDRVNYDSIQRSIIDVKKVDSVPTQCVKVDADNSLYLCGPLLTPTHNTGAKARKWNPKTKSTDGLAEQRQQLMYKMLLEDKGVKISGARLIYPVAQEIVNVDLQDEELAARVVKNVEDTDKALTVMTENNTFEYGPSFLCAWCPLAKICSAATIKPYEKMQIAFASQPEPEILLQGIELR